MQLHEDLLKYFSTIDNGMHYDINDEDTPVELNKTVNKIIRDRVIINRYTYGLTSALTIDNIHLRRDVEYVALSLNDTYQTERHNLYKYIWPKQAVIETFQLPSRFLSFIFPRVNGNKSFFNFITWLISVLITVFKSDIKEFLIALF
ncbi:hypothetical protein [Staphylococcus gallinarum]|uniref:Uncharacterized protein n=2 Tax=Staphylococcus gallinarum TaxID=1293 RepID=A0A380FDU1_STAGA|nr:hypothetical protein [Staphylococcus gallinarum]GEQ04528.1 hypothetical protein SGA02_03560 [Staphylococcus gallinarum]SUM32075.1 Uncharacterised protein [Staphylococcus gallinarum]